ncbi:putative glyoxalase [Paenibacillus agaridevorans]|uniref:Putative glyoxalase n=1 Tax=Paenibacillus agaridevorans TaxID=171404 RepID=A0A2R5EKF5_9BACL|nr:VOC family protein [Paenibacillus agaridevorans]GBG07106.1 putative glyoxalase [Paenibacillus agaridevorans]
MIRKFYFFENDEIPNHPRLGLNLTLSQENEDTDTFGPSSEHIQQVIFYMYVEDVYRLIQKMTNTNRDAEVLIEPEETFWGDIRARLKDPFGYLWDVAQKVHV